MSWKRPYVEDRMRVFLKFLPENIIGNIVDMGTGTGIFTTLLQDKYEDVEVIQSDIRKQRYISRAILHAIGAPPFRHSAVSLILAAQVLHYLSPDLQLSAIKRLQHVLEKGGHVVFIEYVTNQAYYWIPYPIPPIRLKEFVSEVDTLSIDRIIYDEDLQRPKYACYLVKK